MLPVAYRVIKGFATFFGVLGIIMCIVGIIWGILALDKSQISSSSGAGVAPGIGVAPGVGVVPGVGVAPGTNSNIVNTASNLTRVLWK